MRVRVIEWLPWASGLDWDGTEPEIPAGEYEVQNSPEEYGSKPHIRRDGRDVGPPFTVGERCKVRFRHKTADHSSFCLVEILEL